MYKTIIAEDGQKYKLVPVDETEPTLAQQKKKWEPKGGEWYVNMEGLVFRYESSSEFKSFGVEYCTKELAEKARDAMRIHNLLLSRKMEECPNEGDYTMYRHDNRWKCSHLSGSCMYPDTILFTSEVAEKICEELNDPELNFISI